MNETKMKFQNEMAEAFMCLNGLIEREKETSKKTKLERVRECCVKAQIIPEALVIYSDYEDLCLESEIPLDETMTILEWHELQQDMDDFASCDKVK